MNNRVVAPRAPLRWPATRNVVLACGMAYTVALSIPASATATTIAYDAGALDFSSTGQSMWGEGTALEASGTKFFGPQWNSGGSIGGIAGSAHDCSFLFGWFGCPDTRTGAEISVQSSGQLGLKFGYSIDSGSVDTTANFGATANVPQTVAANAFFNIGAQSGLSHGSIQTQSPEVSASMDAVMQLSGFIGGTGCFIGAGCSSSVSPLPSIDVDQQILSIDPNGVDILDGVRPDGKPLAQLPLGGGALTLSAGVGVPGFEVSDQHGTTLFTTLPEGAPTTDLGELDFNVPNVATSASGSGPTISSSGQDDLLGVSLDLDGLLTEAIEAATDVPVPFGFDEPLGDFGNIHVDLADVDIGPYLHFSQGFEFDPTLYVDLAFDHPVDIMGQGWVSSWEGRWDSLPDFALAQTTTFTPTFYLDAQLTNDTGLIFGLDGTWTLLGISGSLGPLTIPGTSLNDLLGWGHSMFDVQSDPVSVYQNTFALGGFENILAPSFTIAVGQGGGFEPVPEPGDLLMLLLGLGLLAGSRCIGLKARTGIDDANHV